MSLGFRECRYFIPINDAIFSGKFVCRLCGSFETTGFRGKSLPAGLEVLVREKVCAVKDNNNPHRVWSEPPVIEIVIEVPRGSLLKRGSTGQVDFISPLPCPFNYGSVPGFLGLDNDLLDALLIGPRMPLGARLRVTAWDAVSFTDRGMTDDKLICSNHPLSLSERRNVLRFFHFYAKCKSLLNFFRRRPGRNACDGWCGAAYALARARPRHETWRGPTIDF